MRDNIDLYIDAMLEKDQKRLIGICGTALDSIPSTGGSDEQRQATLGGLVKVAGAIYGLTVDHLFRPTSNRASVGGRQDRPGLRLRNGFPLQ